MAGPIVIAGGGLAGAAAACLLAQAGRPVVVFERHANPVDKICGEFISAEALEYLERLGLDLVGLGGHRIDGFRLARNTGVVGCRLPFSALGLSRKVLDETLLRHCEASGAEVRRGKCLHFLQSPSGIRSREGEDASVVDTLLLATGKHDALHLRRRVSGVPDLIGIKQHLRLSPAQQTALAGHVEIVLLRSGYAGLQMVEGGMANVCILTSRAHFLKSGGTCLAVIDHLRRNEPHLEKRLEGSIVLSGRPLSIARVPYGFVHVPKPGDPKNVFRLGDQMGVIPSFTGDGMSIALHSAFVAASCILAGRSSDFYHRRMRSDIARQVRLASLLYAVSSSDLARRTLMHVARLFPNSLQVVAKLTRVSQKAVHNTYASPG